MVLMPPTPNRIIMPTKMREFHLHMRVHDLSPEILFADLKNDLLNEAGPDFYACIIQQDGRGYFKPAHEWVEEPDEQHREWLKALTLLSNKHANAGGAWVYAWADANKWVGLWMDRDGDLGAVHYDEGDLGRMDKQIGLDGYVQNACLVIKRYERERRLLDLREGQTVKWAQGQRTPE